MLSPAAVFVVLLIIGIAAGILFDRFAGPGWLTRQIAGQNRLMATSAIVGIAGSFVGYNVFVLLGIIGAAAFIGAILGAAALLWGWRMIK
jgi:uncharacterized membrane protein YeaQ/YmgE (transglycosylase-associated protein family)